MFKTADLETDPDSAESEEETSGFVDEKVRLWFWVNSR